MFLRYDHNEYGTPITVCRCDTCEQEFSLCPLVQAEALEARGWGSCLSPECASYDPSRDVDRLLEGPGVQLVAGPTPTVGEG